MPRRFERSIDIAAPASRVWFVLSDVEAMPTWSPAKTSVVLDPAGPLAVGSTALVAAPKLSASTWTVTELVPGESFTWRSTGAGTTSTATHLIEPGPIGSVTVHFALAYTGWSSRLAGFFAESLTRSSLKLEAEGLKEFCESDRGADRRRRAPRR